MAQHVLFTLSRGKDEIHSVHVACVGSQYPTPRRPILYDSSMCNASRDLWSMWRSVLNTRDRHCSGASFRCLTIAKVTLSIQITVATTRAILVVLGFQLTHRYYYIRNPQSTHSYISKFLQCVPSGLCTITPSSTPTTTPTPVTDPTASWTCSYPVPVSSMCAGRLSRSEHTQPSTKRLPSCRRWIYGKRLGVLFCGIHLHSNQSNLLRGTSFIPPSLSPPAD